MAAKAAVLGKSKLRSKRSKYGSGLHVHVLVAEALTMLDEDTPVSACFDHEDWAWLVVRRKLFVWKHSGEEVAKLQCSELTLPASDLNHHARLACVFPNPNDTVSMSVMAVSPEGIIRYWENVSREDRYVDVNADLQGQEGQLLSGALPLGCLLATTTGDLLLLTPIDAGRQMTVQCRAVGRPRGMLAGFGRRMSSLIFGGTGSQAEGVKVQSVLVSDGEDMDGKFLHILTGGKLQKWELWDDGEKLLLEFDVETALAHCLCQVVYDDECDATELKTWLLDMQVNRDGVTILAAGCNNYQAVCKVHYAFCSVATNRGVPVDFSMFTVTKHNTLYQPGREDEIHSHRFLLSDPFSSSAFIYTPNTVLCTSATIHGYEIEKTEFSSLGERILGAGSVHKQAVFFTTTRAFVTLQPSSQLDISGNLSSMTVAEDSWRNESALMSIVGDDQLHDMSISEDKTSRLKAALLHFVRRNMRDAQAIVEDVLPSTMTSAPDSLLDKIVISLGQQLLDDFPALDPRWAESIPQDVSSTSTSLILMHQLEDKQKAHKYFVTFLREIGIWERMCGVTEARQMAPTCLVLREHTEKLVAANVLRGLHTIYPSVVDSGIRKVLSKRQTVSPGTALTPQDLFYREVSRIDDIFWGLVQVELELIESSDVSSVDCITFLSHTNTIFEGVLKEVADCRAAQATMFVNSTVEQYKDYVPWTARSGTTGLRSLLTKQHKLTVENGIPESMDSHTRSALVRQLVNLSDNILAGYATQVEALGVDVSVERRRTLKKKYESERYRLIQPLLQCEAYEEAMFLGEKYADFRVLTQMCELTDNDDRLQRYMTQFSQEGFAQFVFATYVAEGKQARLFSQPAAHDAELTAFLQLHGSLRWIHDVHTRNFIGAAQTLKTLAIEEQANLPKKKTLLSLSKLAALASDEPAGAVEEIVDVVNLEQDIVLHQEGLPLEVLTAEGLDKGIMPVLTPEELIEVYIGEANVRANEFDFKKALDLLEFIPTTDLQRQSMIDDLKLKIWCAAILQDSWDDIETDGSLEGIKDTILFRTIELASLDGLPMDGYLPSVQSLLSCEELGDLRHSAAFKYLVQAGYEYLQAKETRARTP
ncbi:PREDICTED: nuclear pore complex protein Nup133-like [Priapulus caudatus]|uniref:Nuclear pore complex protein Nup133-like n=1 Tax=Priapulus caudatus TaxID=37621 RepID=A0ABM1ET25_PRICU|nr:PREDICTED: nuclear pore complex protein Nup133-like [Priapulus caudatus]